MPGVSVSLSVRGLANIVTAKDEDDFTFIINGRSHSTHRFFADFLSPKLCHLHASDPSLSELVLETPDPVNQFGALLALAHGDSLPLSAIDPSFLAAAALELGNLELYFSLQVCDPGKLNSADLADRLPKSASFDVFSEEEIDYLASHFFAISSSVLARFPGLVLSRILSSSLLKIESEDSLCDFIISHLDDREDFPDLFEFIRFEFLTQSRFLAVLTWTQEHFDEFRLSYPIWRSICDRLATTVPPANPRAKTNGFEPDPSRPLDGILAHLTKKCGGNVHSKGIVTITSSSIESNKSIYSAHHVLMDLPDAHFGTKSLPDSWIQFAFKNLTIVPTHYTVQTYHPEPSWVPVFPQNWVIEGSLNGIAWEVLDSQVNSTLLYGPDRTVTFPIGNRMECRVLRMRITAPESRGKTALEMKTFEWFGTLLGDSS
jgi:hypothetical protein